MRLPPFGLSDHFTVLIEPKLCTDHQTNKRIRQLRDLRPSRRAAMGAFINDFDCSILNQFQTCEEKLNYFQSVISTGMDILLPVKKSRIRNNEPPWMNHHLKSLIHKRQLALATGNKHQFNHLQNIVNRERKKCRSKFYESKVKLLKSTHPKQWWKSIKVLCGMNPVSSASTFSHLIAPSREPNSQSQSLPDLANTINQTFLSPMEHFQPPCSTTPLPITTCNSESMSSALVITESQVFTKLVSIKSSKAPGPDSIPGWLLKENACALAEPISEILTSSYYENKLPSSWKMADVSPIPKQKPVQDISKHLRPISLTPVISKLAEEFVVDCFIKPAILRIVDSPNGRVYFRYTEASSSIMCIN